jgi:hypothetical protein
MYKEVRFFRSTNEALAGDQSVVDMTEDTPTDSQSWPIDYHHLGGQ